MKNQIITKGIVLARTDFQEADRIVSILTHDKGKLRAIAKGVRRQHSKLAGGIELFSVSDITYIPGRGELGTIVSTRLRKHYGNIVTDIERTMLGYDFLKRMNKLAEDAAGPEYFELMESSLKGLDDLELPASLTELWFIMQVLKVGGRTPNLSHDTAESKLDVNGRYLFDFEAMGFQLQNNGPYDAGHIKLLRLAYGCDEPNTLGLVQGAEVRIEDTLKLAQNIQKYE